MIERNKSTRIQYIDAMRGFTMILVIYHHILIDYLPEHSFSFNDIFVLFRMPLFFFISGFVLYNPAKIWNMAFICAFLKKKFMIQVPSTLFFLLIVCIIFQNNFVSALFSFAKNGYWFTLSLFEYFLLYALIKYMIYKFNLIRWETLVLISYALIVVVVPFISYICPSLQFDIYPIYNLLGIRQLYYFIFFIFGVIIKKFFSNYQDYIFSDKKVGGYILLFGGCILLDYSLNVTNVVNIITKLLEAFSGILVVFSFFRHYSKTFSSENRVGIVLQYVGRRTLDIYLLHYLFLPRNMELFTDILMKVPNPIIEFFVTFLLSILTMFFCLIVSNLIRVSSTLSHVLFGIKL